MVYSYSELTTSGRPRITSALIVKPSNPSLTQLSPCANHNTWGVEEMEIRAGKKRYERDDVHIHAVVRALRFCEFMRRMLFVCMHITRSISLSSDANKSTEWFQLGGDAVKILAVVVAHSRSGVGYESGGGVAHWRSTATDTGAGRWDQRDRNSARHSEYP